MALGAFSLGFGIWAMFAALGPFLIEWYDFSAGQVMFLAAVEPMGAMLLSIPLGVVTDKYGGRVVFSALLLVLSVVLLFGLFVESYAAFLMLGVVLGLGGASFVVGNAHVSVWYPKSRQGTALGIFALGNAGIVLGMVLVPLLVTKALGGPTGYADLPPKLALGPIEGWRLVFLVFAASSLIMAALYWTFTSEPPGRGHGTSMREIATVYSSSKLVWIVAYLYWVSFGTLTFFSAFTPTYLADRWGVDAAKAAMVFTSLLVLCVAAMRPVGGWISDRRDPLTLLSALFGAALVLAITMALEISLPIQLMALYALALSAGAAAACVVKLIPTYFEHVGAVSGLAKAAGAACGFTMTSIMALSGAVIGSYVPGFAVWAAMNAVALYFAFSRVGIPDESESISREAAVPQETTLSERELPELEARSAHTVPLQRLRASPSGPRRLLLRDLRRGLLPGQDRRRRSRLRLDSGDPLFAVDRDLRIVTWNPAVERLTGVPAEQAMGRPCWDVLGGTDADGRSVCHAGCSHARELWAGHPVESPELLVSTTRGRRRVSLSTIGVRRGGQPVLVHTMRELTAARPDATQPLAREDKDVLSPRQRAVLELLDNGLRPAEIALRLGISETTVRNHVRSILSRLGCHSQLGAVAEARRRGIIGGGSSGGEARS